MLEFRAILGTFYPGTSVRPHLWELIKAPGGGRRRGAQGRVGKEVGVFHRVVDDHSGCARLSMARGDDRAGGLNRRGERGGLFWGCGGEMGLRASSDPAELKRGVV